MLHPPDRDDGSSCLGRSKVLYPFSVTRGCRGVECIMIFKRRAVQCRDELWDTLSFSGDNSMVETKLAE